MANKRRTKSSSSRLETLCCLASSICNTDIITLNKRTRKGEKYAISFTDDASRFAWAELLDKREDIAGHLQRMCALIFTQYGRKIKKIRCDNEYASSDLTALVHKEGIVLEPCPAHEKNQNGVAEHHHGHDPLYASTNWVT